MAVSSWDVKSAGPAALALLLCVVTGCGRECAQERRDAKPPESVSDFISARLYSGDEADSGGRTLARAVRARLNALAQEEERISQTALAVDALLPEPDTDANWLASALTCRARDDALSGLAGAVWDKTGDAETIRGILERRATWRAHMARRIKREKADLAAKQAKRQAEKYRMHLKLATVAETDLPESELAEGKRNAEAMESNRQQYMAITRAAEAFNSLGGGTEMDVWAGAWVECIKGRCGNAGSDKDADLKRLSALLKWETGWEVGIDPVLTNVRPNGTRH